MNSDSRAPAFPADALTKGPALTPIAFVNAICRAYRLAGKDPKKLLQSAQITPAILGSPESTITAAQMEFISGNAMQELDDEALGWFSRRLPWGSYGMLVRASISAPTLLVALKRWCRHHGLVADDITVTLSSSATTATISITENRDLGDLREFCLVSVLRNIHGVACWLVDSRIPLKNAEFPFAEPAHHTAYTVLFSGPSSFSAAAASISFDARYLSLPLRRDERALQQMLQHALPLTVLQYRRDRLLVQRVRQALITQPEQTRSAEGLATELHLSLRTLHRQLKEEGASVQSLKDEVRQSRAKDLLLRTTRPVKQIAQAVGFLNEKSFMRAFQGWTGMSPTTYRQARADSIRL